MRYAVGSRTMLRRCEMPAEEIRAVLGADDPAVVHMLLELHAERLREELATRLRALTEVEASLVGSLVGTIGAPDGARQAS
jgi:hypothetical protein